MLITYNINFEDYKIIFAEEENAREMVLNKVKNGKNNDIERKPESTEIKF